MKIIEQQKKVDYYGLELVVLNQSGWLATDSNGEIYYFSAQPEISNKCWFSDYENAPFIAKVDLEGLDWRDTLVRVD